MDSAINEINKKKSNKRENRKQGHDGQAVKKVRQIFCPKVIFFSSAPLGFLAPAFLQTLLSFSRRHWEHAPQLSLWLESNQSTCRHGNAAENRKWLPLGRIRCHFGLASLPSKEENVSTLEILKAAFNLGFLTLQ